MVNTTSWDIIQKPVMLRGVFVFLILLNKSRTDAFLEPVALSNVLAELKDEVLGVKRMHAGLFFVQIVFEMFSFAANFNILV
jgi:hypothetical protein